jgi:hypothetical protein
MENVRYSPKKICVFSINTAKRPSNLFELENGENNVTGFMTINTSAYIRAIE